MRCKFIDPETGDQCKSPFGSLKHDGYCNGHALSAGIVDHAVNKERGRKIRATKTAQAEAMAKLDPERRITAEDIYHKIINDKCFNLFVMVKDYKLRKILLTETRKRNLFIKWWCADIGSREPQSHEGVCDALTISRSTLSDWVDSMWFNEELEKWKKKVDVMLMPHIQKILNIKGLDGDIKALQEYYSQITESIKSSGGIDDIGVSDELLAEGKKLSGIDNNKSGTVKLDDYQEDLSEKIGEDY